MKKATDGRRSIRAAPVEEDVSSGDDVAFPERSGGAQSDDDGEDAVFDLAGSEEETEDSEVIVPF